jgi:hypothetical protein
MIGHIAMAFLIQALVAWRWRSWGAGAAAGAAWVISREIAQAEYRWIERFGGGLRANMPWWGRFDLRVWDHIDPWLDWVVPVIVVAATALAVSAYERRGARSG